MTTDFCVYNAIKTPDGTVLHCEHRHDYKSHEDSNGETYINDGGGFYVRRSLNYIQPIDLSIWKSDGHEKVRNHFQWTTRGYFGDEPPTKVLLKDMSDEHILNILKTQHHLDDIIRQIFFNEMDYRETEI